MEFLIILLLLIILSVVISSKRSLERKLNHLSGKLSKLESEFKTLPSGQVKPAKSTKSTISRESVAQTPLTTPEPKEERSSIPAQEEKQPVENVQKASESPLSSPASKSDIKRKSFFEKYPDIEKFIGENLINKIGIAILVLGIGFFVKFAIDQDWINEVGRVAVGIAAGGILVAFAHKIRKDFKPFSSVLIGGGMAVFYFTIAIAFHEYQLFSQSAAFAIMVCITGFTVLFSVLYNRMELAVVAIVGGFASPFMISTGEGNYIVLFSYVLLLNLGMLVLAYFKKWNLVNIVSYVFTVLLYGGWLLSKVQGIPEAPFAGALVFGTLFYFVFFIMNIINNVKERHKFSISEISILVSNTFLYYSAGMLILNNINEGIYQGLFTAVIAVFNFIFAFSLYRSQKADKKLVYLLIGLVLTFISLAAPVQLEGNYITLFWSLEAVLLLWLSQKSGIKLMKAGAFIVLLLMVVSLVMDWVNIYSSSKPLSIIINKAFVTSLVSLLAIGGTLFLLKNEKISLFIPNDKNRIKASLQLLFILLAYFTGFLELRFQAHALLNTVSLIDVVLGSYNLLVILGISIWSTYGKPKSIKITGLALSFVGILCFMIFYHFRIVTLRNTYLYSETVGFGAYIYHYIPVALTLAIIFVSLKSLIKIFGLKSSIGRSGIWFLIFSVLFVLSAELDHLVLVANYTEGESSEFILNQNRKIGYAILWGVSSFILMLTGMSKKIKELRIISLVLFSITLLKLFIIDIRGISEGGKIAAFICLGILLLIISFMYQRLKKLVTEDEPKTANE